MRIGDVAAAAGVSVRVLRYYEQQRLLVSTRTPAGHRQYEESAVDRVRLIQLFYGAGLSSKAIREVLPSVEAGEATAELVEFLMGERRRVEQRISDLVTVRGRLDVVIDAAVNPRHDCLSSTAP
ncbi:MerR family transcriptional regulator [Streptomyces corynorhini]|uniref:MerR family transcriptional regulator n=1 Tax=Streptomyces corynorhini TaxID=2282652 RepID=A0A370B8P1_9ACTN|nr:MerR family transcriptional regulator [Streptomyces corynorhini]RDG36494.1 MerR family transcriptional regulator [Streptomyces corynorhini]